MMVPPISNQEVGTLGAVADEQMLLAISLVGTTAISHFVFGQTKWGAIDLDRSELAVIERGRAGRQYRRVVPLASALAKRLALRRANSRFKAEDDFIFCDRKGAPFTERYAVARLRALALQAAPHLSARRSSDVNWVELRRFAVLSWRELGLSLDTVAKFTNGPSRFQEFSENERLAIESIANGIFQAVTVARLKLRTGRDVSEVSAR